MKGFPWTVELVEFVVLEVPARVLELLVYGNKKRSCGLGKSLTSYKYVAQLMWE